MEWAWWGCRSETLAAGPSSTWFPVPFAVPAVQAGPPSAARFREGGTERRERLWACRGAPRPRRPPETSSQAGRRLTRQCLPLRTRPHGPPRKPDDSPGPNLTQPAREGAGLAQVKGTKRARSRSIWLLRPERPGRAVARSSPRTQTAEWRGFSDGENATPVQGCPSARVPPHKEHSVGVVLEGLGGAMTPLGQTAEDETRRLPGRACRSGS